MQIRSGLLERFPRLNIHQFSSCIFALLLRQVCWRKRRRPSSDIRGGFAARTVPYRLRRGGHFVPATGPGEQRGAAPASFHDVGVTGWGGTSGTGRSVVRSVGQVASILYRLVRCFGLCAAFLVGRKCWCRCCGVCGAVKDLRGRCVSSCTLCACVNNCA